MSSPSLSIKLFFLIILPYLLGIFISPKIISTNFFYDSTNSESERRAETHETKRPDDILQDGAAYNMNDGSENDRNVVINKELDSILLIEEHGNPFEGVKLFVHRNGEADPCGAQKANPLTAIRSSMNHIHDSPSNFDKYAFDSLFTHALASSILSSDSCGDPLFDVTNEIPEFFNFCDMGEDYTVIQPDHDKLVHMTDSNGIKYLPCHFHTREGVRIASLAQLADLARMRKEGSCSPEQMDDSGTCAPSHEPELHIYAVPAGRLFMFAPKYVGEVFDLPHVEVASGLPVWLEVISVEPRVFDVMNFFDRKESLAIVERALKETSETHRIKRSSTGASGYNVNNHRTSENGFDTHGPEAKKVKRRCLDVLGFDEYIESFTDGLQVLRYNKTTAYIPHLDWAEDPRKREEHNFDSATVGTNRFATILLYMSDLDKKDGGETLFAEGWPVGQPEEERVQFDEALSELRASGDANMLKEGSWEEEMVAKCRSRLAIQPNSARAVLFYSQHPDGQPDESSLHGGCPVLSGEKWAANLWVWNGPRSGFPGAPVNEHVVKERQRSGTKQPSNGPKQLQIIFSNSGNDPSFAKASLYYEDSFWGPLGHNDPDLHVNSYEGHVWNVKVGDDVVKTWTIGPSETQTFTL